MDSLFRHSLAPIPCAPCRLVNAEIGREKPVRPFQAEFEAADFGADHLIFTSKVKMTGCTSAAHSINHP